MVREEDLDTALRHLRESAADAAQARANVKYLSEFLKTKRAMLKLKHTGVSNAAAEDAALAHPEYLEVLEGYKVAVEKDAFHTFKREAAAALVEVWRTEQANLRAEGRAYS